jgi:mannose-6-phosphate isomerase-like protein (cupin superfamily)
MARWQQRRIADVASIPGCDADEPTAWIPLRHELGVQAFGINAFRADAVGQIIVEHHDELSPDAAGGHEEAYVVLEGAIDLTLDGETRRVTAGEIVFVGDPAVVREGRAVEAPALVLAIGAQPGVTFAPSAWEQRELRKNGVL